MPDFELFIGDTKFTHFTEGFVRLSMEQAASTFEFSYVDLTIDQNEPWPIVAGDECTIRLENRLMLTGYIDDISIQYTADSLRLRARGRSKVGDLVDSSAFYKRGRWFGATLQRIAEDLCEPFNIGVEVDPVGDYAKPYNRVAIEHGESVIELLTRIAKYRGLYPVSTPLGDLRFIAVGSREIEVPIEYGRNVINGERFDTQATRHSAYFLKGQSPSTDEDNGRVTMQEAALIIDEGIDRYRPLLLVSTNQKGKNDLKRRAIWERNRRAGQSERLIYRVDGYTYTEGFGNELWFPGVSVRIVDPRLRVDGSLLLIDCAYRFAADGENGGRVTDLTFTRKEAFDLVEAYPKQRRNKPFGDPDDKLSDAERQLKEAGARALRNYILSTEEEA